MSLTVGLLAVLLGVLPGCGTQWLRDNQPGDALILLRRFDGHTGPVLAVAFSRDGAFAVSGGFDRTVRVWDVEDARLIQTCIGHVDAITSVAFSPGGELVVSAGLDRQIRIWNVQTGVCVKTLSGHDGYVQSLQWLPEGDLICSAASDRTIRFWSSETGELVREFNADGTLAVTLATVSPDGRRLLAEGRERVMWDLATGEQKEMAKHSLPTAAASFSPDGTRTLRVIREGVLVSHLGDPRFTSFLDCKQTTVLSGAFALGTRRVICGDDIGVLRTFDTFSGKLLDDTRGHGDRVNAIAVGPTGDLVLTASHDESIRLWAVGY